MYPELRVMYVHVQCTLFQVLSEYFNSDADFNLLCSVFMIIFMAQGRDIEYKVINKLVYWTDQFQQDV